MLNILIPIIFIVLVISVIMALVYSGRRYVYPKGKRVVESYNGFKCTLIYGPGVIEHFSPYLYNQVAKGLAMATWALNEVSETKLPKHIVTHILNDEDYSAQYDSYTSKLYGRPISSNGMLSQVHQKRNYNPLPLVAIRASKFKTTMETGSLQIHELTHYIIHKSESGPSSTDVYDYKHSDPKYWKNQSNDSLEAKAQQKFIEHRREIFKV
jgi:hypothetical protein